MDFRGKTDVNFTVTETETDVSINLSGIGVLQFYKTSAKAFIKSLDELVDILRTDYEPNQKPFMKYDTTAKTGNVKIRS